MSFISDQKSILVFGKSGQLAMSFQKFIPQATYIGQKDISFSSLETVAQAIRNIKPDLIINTAAYTAVDLAETNLQEAEHLNVQLPEWIGQIAKKMNTKVLHFSTDYVFDGYASSPYKEDDITNPLNVYGRTKRDGEQALIATDAEAMIIRTSWLYHENGNNFLNTILKLARTQEVLRVVRDQVGSPTACDDLSQALLKGPWMKGLFHLTCQGESSWYDFAYEIIQWTKTQGMELPVHSLLAITTDQFPRPAKRPLNSRLNCEKAKRELGIELPHWKNSLQACLKRKTIS